MRLSTRLTMLALAQTLKALVHERIDALEAQRHRTPRDRAAAIRRLNERLAPRETGEDDGRPGA